MTDSVSFSEFQQRFGFFNIVLPPPDTVDTVSEATRTLVLWHTCWCTLCVCVPVHMCPCVSAELPAFEVCLQRRSLAENTGMAICDTIDTWHVNIDNNSVAAPPAGLPFSYLHRLWPQTPLRQPLCLFFLFVLFLPQLYFRHCESLTPDGVTYFGNFCSVLHFRPSTHSYADCTIEDFERVSETS